MHSERFYFPKFPSNISHLYWFCIQHLMKMFLKTSVDTPYRFWGSVVLLRLSDPPSNLVRFNQLQSVEWLLPLKDWSCIDAMKQLNSSQLRAGLNSWTKELLNVMMLIYSPWGLSNCFSFITCFIRLQLLECDRKQPCVMCILRRCPPFLILTP